MIKYLNDNNTYVTLELRLWVFAVDLFVVVAPTVGVVVAAIVVGEVAEESTCCLLVDFNVEDVLFDFFKLDEPEYSCDNNNNKKQKIIFQINS